MLNNSMILMQMMPLFAVIALILQQSHLLMALLTLEGITLSLVLLIPMTLMSTSMSASITSILLLTLGVCEASLGLALLVNMSRTYGSDLVNNLTLNKC